MSQSLHPIRSRLSPAPLPALCLGLALAGSCGGDAAPPAAPPPDVLVAEVLVTDLPILSEYVGQTEAIANVDVRARVEGFLEEIAFQEGAPVAEGDLLFRIDREPIEQRLLRARAGLADAEASLLKADQDIARYRPLVEQRAIPRQDLENAEAARLRALAAVDAGKADVRSAELDLSYTEVRAPIAGIIGDKLADVGDLVGGFPSMPLATISPRDPIWFSCNVSEVEYLDTRRRMTEEKAREMPVTLVLADGTEHQSTGRFVFVDRTVDPRTGTLRVRAEFANPDGLLRPGQFGRVRVLKDTQSGAVLVPQRAVQEVQGTYNVYTVDPSDKAVYTRVHVGRRVGSLWQVESGLGPRDRVIVEGLVKVRDGAPVNATATKVDDAPLAALRQLVPESR